MLKAAFTLCVTDLMIPEDCQLQDLFLSLHAIPKFSVIVCGCLGCFPQMLNLHIFMCWYSSSTYLLTCSGWAEAEIPHPKFTLQQQPLNRMAQSVIAPIQKQLFLTLWEVVWVSAMHVTETIIFDSVPQRIFISAFENTPGLWLTNMALEKLAVWWQA